MGTYPEMSIKEIWNSDKTKELREALSHYDYSHGCEGCLYMIASGNLTGTKANNYDGYEPNPQGYPTFMEFELSNTCNLECIMCSGDYSSMIRKNRENRPALMEPYDMAFVDQLEEFIPHLQEVKFYGGEPFLVDIYYKIWERIIAINPELKIQVQTNGTTLHNRFKRLMEQGRFYINLSLDSVNKENCERIRIHSKFEEIMENAAFFHQYCLDRGTDFRISSCIMRQNYWEAADLIRFANRLNTEIYFHVVYQPAHASIQTLPVEEIIAIKDKLLQLIQDLPENTAIEKTNKHHFKNYIGHVERWIKDKKEETNIPDVNNLEDLLRYINKEVDRRFEISVEKKTYIKDTVAAKLRLANSTLPETMDMTIAIMALLDKRDAYLKGFTEYLIKFDIDEIHKHIINYYSGINVSDFESLLRHINGVVDSRNDISREEKNLIKDKISEKLNLAKSLLPVEVDITRAVLEQLNKQDVYLKSFSEYIIKMTAEEINNYIIQYYSANNN